MGRITFVWIVAAAVSSLVIPLSGGDSHLVLLLLLAATALWLVRRAARYLTRAGEGLSAGSLYASLNVHALLVMSLLSAGGILGGGS